MADDATMYPAQPALTPDMVERRMRWMKGTDLEQCSRAWWAGASSTSWESLSDEARAQIRRGCATLIQHIDLYRP